jgi:hypothetical protein
MPTDFKTFGPFDFPNTSSVTNEDLKQFWSSSNIDEGLVTAIGVYILCRKIGSNPPKPWYVGRTDKGFRRRLKQHVRGGTFRRLDELAPNGKLQVFLIARTNPGGKSFKKKGKNLLKSIRMLEFLLIGMCLTRNKRLLNTSEKAFHKGLYVPGYLNNKRGKPGKPARGLAEMLNVE